MRPLPVQADRQFGVFTRPQLHAAGWSRTAIGTALRNGVIVGLHRGIYVSSDYDRDPSPAARRQQLATRSAAAVLARPGAIASHRGAAALAGHRLLTTPIAPCVTVAPERNGSTARVHVHRALLRPGETVADARIARTSSARTVLDIAGENGVDEAVVVADCAIHRQMLDPARLREALAGRSPWPGRADAVAAIRRCDGLSESPLETISRLRIEESDLPMPRLQVNILDDHGRWKARSDFFWDDYGVFGEVDGSDKYRDGDAVVLTNEKWRQERAERTGLLAVRWGHEDLKDLPVLFERIRWTLGRGRRIPTADRHWRVGPPSVPGRFS
jgi:hypothetical protein